MNSPPIYYFLDMHIHKKNKLSNIQLGYDFDTQVFLLLELPDNSKSTAMALLPVYLPILIDDELMSDAVGDFLIKHQSPTVLALLTE